MFKSERQTLAWDDLRIILTVAKAGSLSRAADQLGTSHPTVFRRIRDIERRLGLNLFERSRTGYVATDAATPLIELAERIDSDVRRLELRPDAPEAPPAGKVTLTTSPALVSTLLPPVLRALSERLPHIQLDLASSNQLFDLNRREADIALRSGGDPPDQLIGRSLCSIAVCIYRPRDRDATPGNLHAFPWVIPDASHAHHASMRWLAEQGLISCAAIRCENNALVAHLANEGLGLAVLPCYLGDLLPNLRRVGEPIEAFRSDLWLLWHPELRGVRRIKAVVDLLRHEIHERRDLIEGRCPFSGPDA